MGWLIETLKKHTVLFKPADQVDRNISVYLNSPYFSLKGRIRNAFIETFPFRRDSVLGDADLLGGKRTNFFGVSGNKKGVLRKAWLVIKAPVTTVINIFRFGAEFIPLIFQSLFKHLLVQSKRGWQHARRYSACTTALDDSLCANSGEIGLLKAFGLACLGGISLLGIFIGAAVYYPLKAARFLIRTVTSPVAAYRDASEIHPVLGVLSALVSCAVYVVATFFFSPAAVIFGAKLAHVGITARLVSEVSRAGSAVVGVGSSLGMTVKARCKQIKNWLKKQFGKKPLDDRRVQKNEGKHPAPPTRGRLDSLSSSATVTSASTRRGSFASGAASLAQAGVFSNGGGIKAEVQSSRGGSPVAPPPPMSPAL